MYIGGGINYYKYLGPNVTYYLLRTKFSYLGTKSASLTIDQQVQKRCKATIISLGVAIMVASLIILLLYGLRGSNYIKSMQRSTDLLRESMNMSTGLDYFSLSKIKSWTENFSSSNVIGEGGFNTGYRGTFRDGSKVIKRFKDSITKGNMDFRHEVQVISSIKHQNLLPLRGYSIERTNETLVYNFMENSSLANYMFNSNKPCLPRDEHYKIAVGIV
eukprot:Gb_25447 [translate_table: standard]